MRPIVNRMYRCVNGQRIYAKKKIQLKEGVDQSMNDRLAFFFVVVALFSNINDFSSLICN